MRPAAPAAALTSLHTCESSPSAPAREHGVEHELRQAAAGDLAGQHVLRAVPEHGDDAGEDQEDGDGGQDGARQRGRRGRRRRPPPPRARSARACGFSAVKACITRVAPIASVAKAEASASRSCARRERWRTERPEATSGSTMTGMASSTSPESRGLVTTIIADGAEEQHEIAQRHGGAGAEGGLDLRGVGREARDDLAGLHGVVEAGIEPGEMGEDGGADIRHHPLAERHHEVVAGGAGQREHGHDEDHHAEIAVDQVRAFGREAVVDHAAHGERHGQRRGRRHHQGDAAPRRCGPDSAARRAAAAAAPSARCGRLAFGLAARRRAAPSCGPLRSCAIVWSVCLCRDRPARASFSRAALCAMRAAAL